MPNIEFIPLSLVDDYDKNSNTHPQAQIENIKALMLYVGWTKPLPWEPSLDAPPVHRPDLLLLGCDDDTDEVIAENMAYLRSHRMYMSAEQAQSCP